MAKKVANVVSKPAVSKIPAAAPVSSTPVRNSTVPPRPASPIAARKATPSFEQIARRAYEISQSPAAGSPDENWFRAERELRSI